jgi:hypothetical protein
VLVDIWQANATGQYAGTQKYLRSPCNVVWRTRYQATLFQNQSTSVSNLRLAAVETVFFHPFPEQFRKKPGYAGPGLQTRTVLHNSQVRHYISSGPASQFLTHKCSYLPWLLHRAGNSCSCQSIPWMDSPR